MKCTISGKNIKLTGGIKEALENKLSKLDKYFDKEPEAKIVCSTDAGLHRVEVTLKYHNKTVRSEVSTDDLYVSIDEVIDLLERKIRKFKTKLYNRKNSGDSIRTYVPVEEKEPSMKIKREKTYPTKPMYPEDACLEMELIDHDFYVFTNAESNDVCAVYKRKDGTYGLLSPEK